MTIASFIGLWSISLFESRTLSTLPFPSALSVNLVLGPVLFVIMEQYVVLLHAREKKDICSKQSRWFDV
jgi:hypothetical protein